MKVGDKYQSKNFPDTIVVIDYLFGSDIFFSILESTTSGFIIGMRFKYDRDYFKERMSPVRSKLLKIK